ncbi:MAG TPA: DUF2065 domain-containing protein [Candidatus Acidoferrales bacterium]|nr:DUF2065 domain-containing protein [Candidatus Acidoferrales bacterium]
MPHELMIAIGLVMVLEGALPAAAPRFWQRGLARLCVLPVRVVRLLGLASLMTGWLIVRAVR